MMPILRIPVGNVNSERDVNNGASEWGEPGRRGLSRRHDDAVSHCASSSRYFRVVITWLYRDLSPIILDFEFIYTTRGDRAIIYRIPSDRKVDWTEINRNRPGAVLPSIGWLDGTWNELSYLIDGVEFNVDFFMAVCVPDPRLWLKLKHDYRPGLDVCLRWSFLTGSNQLTRPQLSIRLRTGVRPDRFECDLSFDCQTRFIHFHQSPDWAAVMDQFKVDWITKRHWIMNHSFPDFNAVEDRNKSVCNFNFD